MTPVPSDVAVVIPAYNASGTLGACLDGIARSSVAPRTVIVVDDGSRDDTVRVARAKGCVTVQLPGNGGPGRARNEGVRRAGDCEFVLFVDSDVVIHEDTLARLLGDVRDVGHAAASAVCSPATEGLGFFGRYKNLYLSHKWRGLRGRTSVVNSSAALVRKSIFDSVGGFDETMRIGEDADLGARLARGHTVWLDDAAEVTHLKKYSFPGLVKDTFVKGVRLAAYALRRSREAGRLDRTARQVLTFPYAEISGFFLGPASAAFLAAAGMGHPLAVIPGALAAAAFLACRGPFIGYLARQAGPFFSLGAMAYMVVESCVCLAALCGGLWEALGRSSGGVPLARFTVKWLWKYYVEQVVFFVTARCNCRCDMCFYHEEGDAADEARELTTEEIRSIARSMGPFYQLSLGGGEPFLRKDVFEICRAFIEHSGVRQIVIPTNGWHSSRIAETVRALVGSFPDVSVILVLSIDGMRDLHDRIRGMPGSFDRAVDTYRRLAAVRASFPNLAITANTTITGSNEHEIVGILKHLDAEFEFNDLLLTLVRFKARQKDRLRVDLANYKRGIEFLLRRKLEKTRYEGLSRWLGRALLVKDVLRYRAILDLVERGRPAAPCYAGRIAVMINEEGRVAECEIRKTEIGDLRAAGLDFNKLYSGDRCRQVYRKQSEEGCSCTYECYLPFNILLHPMSLPGIIKAAFTILWSGRPETVVFGGCGPGAAGPGASGRPSGSPGGGIP